MAIFSYRIRMVRGVVLFLRVLFSYRLLALGNLFRSPARKRARLTALHARNARLLRERMVELRGMFIKIGQFLSSRVDLLPEEYTAELSKLQDQVPPTPFSHISRRVSEELGPMGEVYSSFDEEPIASASLGQVHYACLRDGTCVAVKVQYPGIENVIAADVKTLNLVVRITKLLYRRINLDVVYSEFSRIIGEELDYLQEGRNAEAFARNFAGNPRIIIPKVLWQYTTPRVLTLEYLEGIKITDIEEIDAQGIDRKEIVRILAEAYSQMFFADGFFHGDPHPGNIFVRPGPEVIFVDFGMVDRITTSLRAGLRRAFTAVVDRDSLGLVRALVDMGFIPLTRDIRPVVQFVERLLQKYRDLSPREVKSMDIEEIGRDIMESLQIGPSIQIPNEFILFGRSVGMLNGLSSRLDPETNIIEIAAPFARRFIRADLDSLEALAKQARTAGRSALRLPKLLTDFLVSTGRGETRVEITSKDVADELRKISRIGKGFILAVLVVGLGVAAVLLRINGFGIESLWIGGTAAAALLWLVFVLRKT